MVLILNLSYLVLSKTTKRTRQSNSSLRAVAQIQVSLGKVNPIKRLFKFLLFFGDYLSACKEPTHVPPVWGYFLHKNPTIWLIVSNKNVSTKFILGKYQHLWAHQTIWGVSFGFVMVFRGVIPLLAFVQPHLTSCNPLPSNWQPG